MMPNCHQSRHNLGQMPICREKPIKTTLGADDDRGELVYVGSYGDIYEV